MNFFERHKVSSKRFKETDAYKKHMFAAKIKIKLTFIFYGLGMIFYVVMRKFIGTDSYTVMFSLAIACFMAVTIVGDKITRKNFKE